MGLSESQISVFDRSRAPKRLDPDLREASAPIEPKLQQYQH